MSTITLRRNKAIAVWLAALYAALVAFNNIADYAVNFEFVAHVLMMDTTFADNQSMWRAINAPLVHHAAYALIIAAETAVAALCALGGWRLFINAHDAKLFARAKSLSVAGLGLGVALWFGGFIAIGGEWFLMWQSPKWSGNQSAFRIAAMFALFLIYVTLPERDDSRG